MKEKLSVFGLTDKGNVRKDNQDRIYFAADGNEAVCVVADGMGGSEDGAFAAEAVKRAAERFWHKAPSRDKMAGILNEAHTQVRERFGATGVQSGTTATILYAADGKYYIAHIGDSRVYKICGGLTKKPRILTTDDTWTAKMVGKGLLTEKEALTHPKRHTLTDCIGLREQFGAEETEGEISGGDVYLLCSDGLYNCLTAREIRKILLTRGGSEKICESLIGKVLSRRADDNVSAVVLTTGRV